LWVLIAILIANFLLLFGLLLLFEGHVPKLTSGRKKLLLGVLITNFLLFFGGSINPLVLNEQLHRRIDPSSLLEPDSPQISVVNTKFEKVLLFAKNRTEIPDNVESPRIYEIKLIEAFVWSHVKYKSDFIQYLAVDHLATTSEVLDSKRDDCDGRAILAGSLLLHRGYDAWVFVSWTHWWVEVLLEDGSTLQILTQRSNNPWSWYMKFNDAERVFRGSRVIGFILYNFLLASLIPFLLPRLYGTFPRDVIFKFFLLLFLLLWLIPLVSLLVFRFFAS